MSFNMFGAFIKPIFSLLFKTFSFVIITFSIYILVFYIVYGRRKNLSDIVIKHKGYDLMRWLWIDFKNRKDHINEFKEYGFTIFCGRQGAGKTIAMVDYLRRIKHRYPNCLIVTNFDLSFADYVMKSWRDFFEIRNGTDGVVFAIDEIHTEYSSDSWKDFPESLLSEISQQRKQRIKIVATSQKFSRVVKSIREQTETVIHCRTLFGRLTRCKVYDADTLLRVENGVKVARKEFLDKYSFVQSDDLRNCYDTYAKIERMKDRKFLTRQKTVE